METNGPILPSNRPSVRKHRKRGLTTHFKQMGHPTILKKKWYFWVDMGRDRVLRLFYAFFRKKILNFGHFTGQLLVWDIIKKWVGLIKMGHPTIFEKMVFWGKYGLDQGSEAVLWQWGLNHSQSERNKPRKTTFLFPSFPFKGCSQQLKWQ